MDKVSNSQRNRVAKFVMSYLRRDGSFIVRMVAKNSSDLIAAELLSGLWDQYLLTIKSNSNEAIDTKPGELMANLESMRS